MPFILRFFDLKVDIEDDKKEEYENLKKKYDRKLYQTRGELIEAQNELSDEFYKLTGKKVAKYGCKYGTHTMMTIGGDE